MKILVTGGAGFVGSNIVKAALARGDTEAHGERSSSPGVDGVGRASRSGLMASTRQSSRPPR